MLSAESKKIKSYSHVIFAACFAIQAVGVGAWASYGVHFNSLQEEFQCSRLVIAGASSLAFMMMGLVGILIGRLNDRYGPRLLMSVTSIFFGAGFMLMSQAHGLWQLYLFYGFIFGIGLSSIDVIALTTIARWFTIRRGMMTGLIKVGTGAGQFTLPLLAGFLAIAVGWRMTFFIFGVCSLVILFTIAQFLKRDPEEMTSSSSSGQAIVWCATEQASRNKIFDKARRTWQFWILCVVNFIVVFILISIIVHIVPHARDLGLSPTQAAGVLSAIGGVSMIGRFVSGAAIDRYGCKPVMLVSFGFLTAGLLWLQTADSLWMLYLFTAIYGLAHGGFFTAVSPMAAEIFGMSAHGTILGIIVCFGTAGGAIGPMITGQIFDVTGSYSMVFLGFIVISLLGLGVLLPLKPVGALVRQ